MIESERSHQVFAEKQSEILQTSGHRQGAFQVPEKWIWKTQILNHDSVVCRRSVDSRGDAWPATRIDFAIRFERPGQKEVAVTRKLCAERRTEIWQGLVEIATAQKDFSRAQRTGRDNYFSSNDRSRLRGGVGLGAPIESGAIDRERLRLSGLEVELAEVNTIAVHFNRIDGLDLLDLMQRINFRAILLGERDVIQIERVLCVNVTAQHAVAAVNATVLHDALAIHFIWTRVNADLHQFGFASGILRRGDERFCAGRHVAIGGRRQLTRFQHVTSLVVERI